MAASLSRRLCRTFLQSPSPRFTSHLCKAFCTDSPISIDEASEYELNSELESELELEHNSESVPPSSSSTDAPFSSTEKPQIYDRPLENGLDPGTYKAILVGQVGQNPMQKQLKSGTTVTLLSIGTGGIRNNRRPLDNEQPKDYANRCSVQWHRVSVYPERLGDLVKKHATPGTILYLEGNLETKIFSDPITGLVRRVREVAIRRNGRVVFLGNGANPHQSQEELRGIGYY